MKVTKDFQAYTFLRYDFCQVTFLKKVFSLIGEVGGYTGLLLGYSLMDVPPLLKSLCDVYNNIYVWILLKVK